MDEKRNVEFLFNKVGLYSKEKFTIIKYSKENAPYVDEDELFKLRDYLGVGFNKIESYCIHCKKNYPFDYKIKVVTNVSNNNLLGKINIADYFGSYNICVSINVDSNKIDYSDRLDIDNVYDSVNFLQYDFYCSNSEKTHYSMVVRLEIKDGAAIVQKVGQYPSTLEIFGDDFKAYDKLLESFDAKEDYRKSYISYCDAYYVAAFVYLRRVLEKIVDSYTKDKDLPDKRFETRMDACKEEFDPEIRDTIKNLYSILSLGVHSLTEEQCREYYQYVKAIIEIQLEHIKSQRERKNKIEKNKNALLSIATSLSKKQ